jgi:hypothetical protein
MHFNVVAAIMAAFYAFVFFMQWRVDAARAAPKTV